MKRNWDLCYQILLDAEAFDGFHRVPPYNIEGYPAEQVAYNVQLLSEAGLLVAIDLSSRDFVLYVPQRLTWQGHEFLEPAKQPGVWEKAMSVARDAGYEVLKAWLIHYGKQQLGL